MPRLCAGEDAACDCCVASGADVELLAGGDWAKSGAEKHEDKVKIVARRLTMECLLQSPVMPINPLKPSSQQSKLAAIALRPAHLTGGPGESLTLPESGPRAPVPISEACRRL